MSARKTTEQAMSVKRALVEFHNFASLGEPERALRHYREENIRRGGLLTAYRHLVPALSPFLEIGANAGHTSYFLANERGADGFALDLSADALVHGQSLMTAWDYQRSPVLVTGDALRLPFRDGSLALVMTFQTLSQFPDTGAVLAEAARVLAPGGAFFFAEEPVRRILTLGLYRAPYPEQMNTWEKWLFEQGWLEFIARDVIGAGQEESFGIRQNHRHNLNDWYKLLHEHFEFVHLVTFDRNRGWPNKQVQRVVWKWNPQAAPKRCASLLGATLAGICRKGGELPPPGAPMEALACPDCADGLDNPSPGELRCPACGYTAQRESGVFNLLNSKDRAELYPGPRPDILNFSKPGHESGLFEGFFDNEGSFGNRYRWIGPKAAFRLIPARPEPAMVRIRGYAHPAMFEVSRPKIGLAVNGAPVKSWRLDRPGLFVLEAPLPAAPEYRAVITASPVWRSPDDHRGLTVNLSEIRLAPRD
jgi:SAM-dependent methyltransferase